ncbi:DUF3299 domain-containing protein [Eilatimonas milleporae]|uniref:Uncharacterized protein DUF3299 n=1 Tax=Eilatimonas milleporae TaxID=911205 RepID=A0A3M0CCV9_9PROT|nr:DUF3299 domain-containing protein [Eilatimonas milleporae]RMB04839.1 uncharacterized protein DUF3299 [Eilatimonas milleporae]
MMGFVLKMAAFLCCILAIMEPAHRESAAFPPPQEQGYADPDLLDPDGIWQPAPTPPGAVSWATFATTKVTETFDADSWTFEADFSEAVKALEGQRIKVNGFMLPLQNADTQTHFILMAYPQSCPFHFSIGPSQLIEVKADFGVAFSYEPILIEGTLNLITDKDNGLVYRLSAASAVAG